MEKAIDFLINHSDKFPSRECLIQEIFTDIDLGKFSSWLSKYEILDNGSLDELFTRRKVRFTLNDNTMYSPSLEELDIAVELLRKNHNENYREYFTDWWNSRTNGILLQLWLFEEVRYERSCYLGS